MRTSDQSLVGRVAVVTGASSGIGKAVALALAQAGADVAVGYLRSRDSAEAVVTDIRRKGRCSIAVRVDVTDSAQIAEFGRIAEAELGAVYAWVNMAGADILTTDNARLSDREKLERLLAVDLRGTLECSWHAAERLTSGGVILNTSWDQALRGMAGREAELFGAVKGGITGFSLCLARSLAPRIRVNVLAPGWIETTFAKDDLSSEDYREIAGQIPMGRFGRPADVAQAAVFLVSDAASFITGQTVMINGGMVA